MFPDEWFENLAGWWYFTVITDMFPLSTYIENILMDDSVYDDTDEEIEENGEQIFETVRIQRDRF